ncbi:hypothetical protein BC829DRAFT_386640 [Chytridium lagenaria]|nr:hypothetical protein BC829DRAFT_386640 [Chytridium lagenaria]
MFTKIVIVGGSVAGVAIATELDKLLDPGTTYITLIEERDSYYNAISSVRTVVESGFSDKIWVPYTNLFLKHENSSEIIRARAVSVDAAEKTVELSNGDKVGYHYLVVATGTTLPAPGKTTRTTKEDGKKDAEAIVDAVKKASSVVIVGGGVVGVEIAGEIATDYPNTKVTLIHSGPELLHTTAIALPNLRAALLSNLKALNINVILNDRVELDASGHVLPNDAGYHIGKHTIKTATGKTFESEVQLNCTGKQTPNSEWIVKGLGRDAVDDKGFVKVKLTGQLINHPEIFSLGDVSTLDDHKVAVTIGVGQAPVVSKNIVSLINKPSAPLQEYTPVAKWYLTFPMVVSTGRTSGAGQLPFFGVIGNTFVKRLKSGDLFAAKPWATLNLAGQYPK